MGVDVVQIDKAFSADLSPVQEVLPPEGSVDAEATYAYVFSHDMNNAAIAVNRLLQKNYKVYFAAEGFMDKVDWPEGTVIVLAQPRMHNAISTLAKDFHLEVHALNKAPKIKAYLLKMPRIGPYLPLVGRKSNMEEGHTRLVLDQHEFPFTRIQDPEIIEGNLREKYDVLIMADGLAKAFYEGPPQPHPLATRGLGDEGV